MSWTRTARASKTAAASNISAMLAAHVQPSLAPNPEGDPSPPFEYNTLSGFPLKLRFKREVWNAYTSCSPPNSTTSRSPPKSRGVQKPKHSLTIRDNHPSKAPKRSPVPRQCKVKLTRFHYGGPDRRERGKYTDMITLETPCLRPTCANCQRWHGHVLRDSSETDGARTRSVLGIGPRQVKWQDACDAARPRTTLKLRLNGVAPENEGKCDICLPDSVSAHTSPTTAASKATSCETLRRSCNIRLRFGSDAGKASFRALVHMQARREIRTARKRLGRMAEEAVRQTRLQRDGVDRQMLRPRHRVKFTVDEAMGRGNNKRLVGTYV